MVEKAFSSTAYVSDDSEFSFQGIFEKLSAKYLQNPSVGVHQDGSNIRIDFGSWFLIISYAGPSEITDPASTSGKPIPEGLDFSTSHKVAIEAEDAYPNLDHFNDFLIVCERLCDAYEGVFVRDNASGRWI